jgi:hypothetical protein
MFSGIMPDSSCTTSLSSPRNVVCWVDRPFSFPTFSHSREVAVNLKGLFPFNLFFLHVSAVSVPYCQISFNIHRFPIMVSIPVIGFKSESPRLDVEDLLSKLDMGEKISLLSG